MRRFITCLMALATAVIAVTPIHASAATSSAEAAAQWLLEARHGWGIWASDTPLPPEGIELTAGDFKPTYARDTFEAIHALQALGKSASEYQPAVIWAAGHETPFAISSSARIRILQHSGQAVSQLLNELARFQNSDGGYGATAGYPSDILSTASALEALAAAGEASSTAAAGAVSYLLSLQSADGGFAEGDNSSSVYLTAQAFRGLYPYRHQYLQVPAALDKAKSFLLTQRDASGSWGETFNTALALTALIPYLPDLSPVQTSITALASAQLANGSFDNDPYTTALALQALYLASLPQTNPDYATIKGKVIEAQTGLPLSGVTVTLAGAASRIAVTAGDGVFEFLNLPAGSYSVNVTLSNYAPLATATTARFGQTIDLGTLALTKATGASTGTIRGIVTDASTGSPLADALVIVDGIGMDWPVATDSQGSYQIANVPAISVTVMVSKSGYGQVSGSGKVPAGGVFVFSPALTPGGASTAAVQGVVTSAATGLPLPGVQISATSAAAPVYTDSEGTYRLEGLIPGLATLTAVSSGYDTVTAQALIFAGSTIAFSPRLYPEGTTPPEANTAAVGGIVLDAGSGAPISGATVSLSAAGATKSAATGADGRFEFSGLASAEAALTFTAAGYVRADLSVFLEPLQALDLGQVRLRKEKVSTLLPDLAVGKVDRAAAPTDPQTLAVSGNLSVSVVNGGTATAGGGVSLLAFYDANRNGAYDQGLDVVLGQAQTWQPIVPGETASVSISVQGTLPFRDAPIYVAADSAQAVIEAREDNNVGASTSACEIRPAIGAFEPMLKWAWTGSPIMPDYKHVGAPPIVAQTTDDSGDGKISEDDDPDVIFPAFFDSPWGTFAILRIISGKDGSDIVAVSDPAYRLHWYTTPAVADLDGDGVVEIVAGKLGGGLICFDHAGNVKWINTSPPVFYNDYHIGAPSIADLDGDGHPEILYGNTVLNGDGTVKWAGNGSYQGGSKNLIRMSIAADINLTGRPALIAGASAYDYAGALLWQNTAVGDGFTAVANFNDDPYPEIVVVSGGRIFLLDHFGSIIWGPVALPGGGHGGPPTIADLDGDGKPEIGVAGAGRYVAFDTDGSILWTSPTQDYSSNITGSSVFDFEGDGKAEIVYADELRVRVYEGASGRILLDLPHASGTGIEYPVIADLDKDGHADLLVASNHFYGSKAANGIRVFQDKNNSWVNTRRIWNQHSYHITNVNDDGTVPRVEQNSWQVHNTYRLNALIGQSPTGVPDLTAGMLKLIDNGVGTLSSVTARIGNAGAAPTPGSAPVAFYQGDPAAGGTLLGSVSLAALGGGEYRDLRLDNVALVGGADLYAVVDPQNKVSECNETNNTVWAPASASTPLGRIAVSTDALMYGAYSAVQISATATNLGALPAIFSVALRIEDSNGFTVSDLAARSLGTLAGGASQSLTDAWNTGTTLAGTYRVRATLLGASGEVLHEATTSFEIRHPEGAGPAVMLRLTTDRPVYYTTDQVNIQSLIGNVTTNTIVESAVIRITITDPAGQVVLQRDGALGQLLPGSVRDMVLPYAFQDAAVAVYRVRGEVLDASSAVLASAETRYEVRFDLGKALVGRVEAATATLEAGATQTCTYNLTNTGTLAMAGLDVRYALANMDTQQWLQEEAKTLSLQAGEQNTYVRGFATTGLTPGHYACVLLAQVNGAMKTLAYAPFTLTEPPVKISAALNLGPKGRLLVLIDAPRAGAPTDSPSERAAQDANPDRDPHGPDSAPGLSAQRAFLERLLKQAGWSYTITESAEGFTHELRSGGYSAYALFSEHEKLSEDAQKELREAVFRGEGLMVAGAHDSRHDQLWEALGLTYKGEIAHAEAASLAGLELTGEIALLAGDSVLRISRESAESLATYRLASGADACEGAANSAKNLTGCVTILDALTLNTYGQGKSLFAGFDLLAAATQTGEGSLAAQLLLKALGAVHPAALDTVVQRVVPVELVLSNEGIATPVKAILTLPEGVSLIEAANATVQGNTLTWETTLVVAEEKRLTAYLRLPATPGSLTVAAQVLAPKGGVETLTATANLSFTVAPAPELATITATLESLASADQSLNPAVQHLRQAQTHLAAGRFDQALHSALLAADVLAGRVSADTAPIRAELARWIRWLEIRV